MMLRRRFGHEAFLARIARPRHARTANSVAGIAAVLAVSAFSGCAPANAVLPTRCPWTSSVVASGLGSLENLAFDGVGGMLLSRTVGDSGQIYRLTPDGRGSTLVPDLTSPGSIFVTGGQAFFTTGNSFLSGVLGRGDGTIGQVDLTTGATKIVTSGLSMPNGMTKLPDGSFVVSRVLGLGSGLTSVSADGQAKRPYASPLSATNGVTYDEVRNAVITSLDFHVLSTLAIIDVNDPKRIQRVNLGLFGLIGFPDDVTGGGGGLLYLAMDAVGVVQVNPDANSACIVYSGTLGTTSVRFGSGPGWDPKSLYSTDLSGTVRKLTPTQ